MSWLNDKIVDNFIKISKAVKSREILRLKKNGQLTVGAHTYGINHLTIHTYKGSEAKVSIGKFCSLGPNILMITGGIHPTDWASTFPFKIKWNLEGKYADGMPSTKGDINIGHDVWIGTNVTILSGVKIGHGAVLASNSLVTRDVEPYAIVGGNPAREIRKRFDDSVIKELLTFAWWNLPDAKIIELVSLLNSSDIDNLLKKLNEFNEKA